MRILNWIIAAVFSLLLLLGIGSLFVSGGYVVVRGITIERPVDAVFDYIAHLQNQLYYSNFSLDPHATFISSGIDAKVGFLTKFTSEDKRVGSGEYEIMRIEANRRLMYEIRFVHPIQERLEVAVTTRALSARQTLVEWEIRGYMSYWTRLTQLFVDVEQQVGQQIYITLENLKKILEQPFSS